MWLICMLICFSSKPFIKKKKKIVSHPFSVCHIELHGLIFFSLFFSQEEFGPGLSLLVGLGSSRY